MLAALRSRSTETVPPISLLPRPRIVTGCFFGPPSAKIASFAARQECHSETDCQGSSVDAFVFERPGDLMGQGQIHVVAADQNMVADGDPPQAKLAFLFGHADQREIGRAAADVANQQRIADFQFAPPAIAPIRQPGIHRRLRLFQQHEALGQPGGDGRFARQLASAGVERGRHGEHDMLLAHRGVGIRGFPSGDQMLQIATRGGHRRCLGHLGRRSERQDRLMAIDVAVAEPRLGRDDGSRRHVGRLLGEPIRRPRSRSLSPTADRRCPKPVLVRRPDRETTAASAAARRPKAPRVAESAAFRLPRRRRPAGRTPARCSSFPDRCRADILQP